MNKTDPVRAICDLISKQDTYKLKADIEELTNRYRHVVRDVLIVLTNPDSPEPLVIVMSDEMQYQIRSMLDRVDSRKLETAEAFLPLLLAFQDLDLLVSAPAS